MTDLVSVTGHFKSSARVNDKGFDPSKFLGNFVCHGTVRLTLNSLCSEVSGSAQRAFTLTGPYGSGKSTFALFLDCLLSPDKTLRKRALGKIKDCEETVDCFNKAFPYKNGWGVVKHLCDLNAPVQAIAETLVAALTGESVNAASFSDAECLQRIEEALEHRDKSLDGVVLIVDELGKALDYQATKGGDLHFFQSLADIFQSVSNAVIIGTLHQSFAAYARKRDSSTQDEWGKVQGRYKDFGFNPSADESLYLIGESFEVNKALQADLAEREGISIQVFVDNFGGVRSAFNRVLPIDPVVASLLGPISKRSFSQNERSLFSFIATHERYGFRDYLKCQEESPEKFRELYRVDVLWDYLYHNLGHMIAASSDSRAWLEACDAVDRARLVGDELNVHLTKLIALFSLAGLAHKLYASKTFLLEYFSNLNEYDYDAGQVESAIKLLEEKSIVIFRHNLNSYHIFRASDLDINRLVLDWVERVKQGVDWTEATPKDKLILANAHYHRTGVMRWALTQVVRDIDDLVTPEPKSGAPIVNFVIPVNASAHSQLRERFALSDSVAVAQPMALEALEASAVELIALIKLKDAESEKLARDPIARSEIESREEAAKRAIRREFDAVLRSADWEYMEGLLEGRTLTEKVSQIADKLFNKCPAVHNELIGRTKLSGTSNSALNKLLLALLSDDCKKEGLGFSLTEFPPEKGIYLSCLKRKGWHTPKAETPIAGNWLEIASEDELPEEERDAYVVWRAAVDMIRGSSELVTVSQLYDFWMAPPYGMALGVCKLWTMALLKSLETHLAFYDLDSTKNWMYVPELDEVLVEKIWRYPSEAGIRYYELADSDTSLIRSIANAANADTDQTVLDVGRSLVRQAHRLPSWVKRTSALNFFNAKGDDHLSPVAKRFRDVVLAAQDPYKLVLSDIPALFAESGEIEEGLRQCIDGLLELDTMLSLKFQATLLETIGTNDLEELGARCDLVGQNASRPEIESFARRIVDWCLAGSSEVFEGVMTLVIGVRKDSWTDQNIRLGHEKLRDLCRQFRRHESFISTSGKAVRDTVPISLMYNEADGSLVELEQFVSVGKKYPKEAKLASTNIKASLDRLPREQRVRMLVELLAEEMESVGVDR